MQVNDAADSFQRQGYRQLNYYQVIFHERCIDEFQRLILPPWLRPTSSPMGHDDRVHHVSVLGWNLDPFGPFLFNNCYLEDSSSAASKCYDDWPLVVGPAFTAPSIDPTKWKASHALFELAWGCTLGNFYSFLSNFHASSANREPFEFSCIEREARAIGYLEFWVAIVDDNWYS